MLCRNCGASTLVLDSRELTTGEVRRRRQCKKCGERFNTRECYVADLDQKEEMVRQFESMAIAAAKYWRINEGY